MFSLTLDIYGPPHSVQYHELRRLTVTFLQLALADSIDERVVPMRSWMEQDRRWRRLVEAWCQYMLRLRKGELPAEDSEPRDRQLKWLSHRPIGLVRQLLLSCQLEQALKNELSPFPIVERASKVNDLVEAMCQWMTSWSPDEGRRYAEGLVGWIGLEPNPKP